MDLSYLSVDAPEFRCLVRKEYLFDHQHGHGEFIPGKVISVCFRIGVAPTFDVIMDNGVYWTRLPIIALCWKPDAKKLPLHQHVMWDCQSQFGNVRTRPAFKDIPATLLCDDGNKSGEYLYTVECAHIDGNSYPDHRNVLSFVKSGHLFKVETGHFFMFPNYKILWGEGNLDAMKYKIDSKKYSVKESLKGHQNG
jgi:hypothetical protein